jgi:hypothetical protein
VFSLSLAGVAQRFLPYGSLSWNVCLSLLRGPLPLGYNHEEGSNCLDDLGLSDSAVECAFGEVHILVQGSPAGGMTSLDGDDRGGGERRSLLGSGVTGGYTMQEGTRTS